MEKNITQLFETYPLEVDILGYLFFLWTVIFMLLFSYVLMRRFSLKLPAIKRNEKVKIDFSNPKKTAYTVTYLIHKYESPYNRQLLKKLEKYKYRREVSNFDRETKELIKKFIKHINLNDA